MKKISYFLFLLCSTGVINAQTKVSKELSKKSIHLSDKQEKQHLAYNKSVVWQDDFSNPANWSMTNSSSPSADWTISTDPNAAPRSEFRPFAFTTLNNGYAIIDSDAQGQGNSQDATITYTGTIDLSAYANVSLTFEQAHRRYQETTTVLVSNDNGVSWTAFTANEGMSVNTNTENPAIEQINISSVAANQSQVKIAFQYQGAWDWFWAIDDLKIIETYDYDLIVNSSYWGTTGNYGVRLPYSQVPSSQVQPIDFSVVAKNIGALAQSGIVLNTTITEASFTNTSNQMTLAPGATDTIDANISFTPSNSLNVYNPSFSVSSPNTDAEPLNNILSGDYIEVTSSVYARDKNIVTGGSYNQGEAYEVGNVFDIFTNAQTNSGSVWIRSSTVVGAQVYLRLYSIDNATGDFVFMEESNTYTITTDDLGTLLSLDLLSAVDLTAGQSYLLVAGSLGDGGATDDLIVGTSGISEAQTTYYLDGTDNTWYYTTSTPIVRMNLSVPVTITSSNPSYTFCSGGSMTLVSSELAGNQWNLNGNPITGETNDTLVVTAAGIYSVTAGGNTSPSVSASVQVINTNILTLGYDLLSAETNSSATFQWIDCSNSSVITGETSADFSPMLDGDYQVQISLNGCSATAPCVNFTAPIIVSSTNTNNNILCSGETLTLSSSKVTGNQWNFNNAPLVGETNQTLNVSIAGDYYVVVGLDTSEIITVQTVILDNTVSGTIILTATEATPGVTYMWANCLAPTVSLASTQTFTPSTDGDYSVEVSLNGCSALSTCTTVTLPLAISAIGNTSVCAGETVDLTSTKVLGNQWQMDGTNISGATSQTYTATVSGIYTCVNGTTSNSITVTVAAPVIVTVTQSANTVDMSADQAGASYKWVDCAAPTVSLATTQTFSATVNGSYQVIVTVGSCSDTSTCKVVQGVGITENTAFSYFSVYPNPAAENVAIEYALKNESKVNVSISDLSGKVVYTSNLGSKTAGSHNVSVNTTSFANGIYVVNFATTNGIVTEKLVIRK
ncbi:MAG: T9SS type A sorting domain-containing protein [Bacteroidota bacterium]